MPLKKKPYLEPVENSSESSSEEEDMDDDVADEDSDDTEGEEAKEILIDFEGRSPNQQDFDGIKQLLNQLFHTAPLNTTALTNLVLDQHYVGSVLTQCTDDDDDDDDVYDEEEMNGIDTHTIFGVTTAINLNNPNTFVTELKNYILTKCMKHADADIVKKVFKDSFENASSPIGFIINERFVNIPFKISIPLLETLRSEISRACDKKKPFNFEFYCMMLKMYRKTSKKDKNTFEYVYSNPEDEIISEDAMAGFEFCITDDEYDNDIDSDELFIPYRKIVLFESELLPEIIQSIKQNVE